MARPRQRTSPINRCRRSIKEKPPSTEQPRPPPPPPPPWPWQAFLDIRSPGSLFFFLFQVTNCLTQCYALQRYMQACGGRAAYPIKFNGGIFTVEPKRMGKPFNADWRAWGDCHWWQNVRPPYHPMLANGDFEMMDPLFRLYGSVRPLCEARAKIYHNVRGCYFRETITVWGTYSNGDYGWNRAGHQPKDVLAPWWCYAWNQGPELVALMLDRWDYTETKRS